MKSKQQRISFELMDLLKERRDNFGTSIPKESRNVAKILNELESNLGIDIKNTSVTKNGINLNSKWKIRVFK